MATYIQNSPHHNALSPLTSNRFFNSSNIQSPSLRKLQDLTNSPSPQKSASNKRRATEDPRPESDENANPFLSPTKRVKSASSTPVKASLFTLTSAMSDSAQRFGLRDISNIGQGNKIPSSEQLEKDMQFFSGKQRSPPKQLAPRGKALLNRGAKSSITSPRRKSTSPSTPSTPLKTVQTLRYTPSPPSRERSIDAILQSLSSSPTRDRSPEAEPEMFPIQKLEATSAGVQAGWFFEIREDTAEDTIANIMSFSAGGLDISDEERTPQKLKNTVTDCGKENVPPEGWVPPPPSPSKARAMQEEQELAQAQKSFFFLKSAHAPRAALAELAPEDLEAGASTTSGATTTSSLSPSSSEAGSAESSPTLPKSRSGKSSPTNSAFVLTTIPEESAPVAVAEPAPVPVTRDIGASTWTDWSQTSEITIFEDAETPKLELSAESFDIFEENDSSFASTVDTTATSLTIPEDYPTQATSAELEVQSKELEDSLFEDDEVAVEAPAPQAEFDIYEDCNKENDVVMS